MKSLEGYDLTWTLFIIKVMPSLEELYLTICSYPKLDLFFLLYTANFYVRFCKKKGN
jgi:hypothetical protein